jgi:hypothetical protein
MFNSTIDLRGGQFNGSIIVDPATDYFVNSTIYTGASSATIEIEGVSGQPAGSNAVTVYGGGGDVTVQFDVAASQASETQNADGSVTVNAGPDGTATLFGVHSIVFTGQFAGPIGPTPQDFYAAGTSDILFDQADGSLAIWKLNGTLLDGGGPIGNPGGTWSVVGTGNFFTNPVTADILFQDASHNLAIWRMAGVSIVGGGSIGNPGGTWDAIAVGNFTGESISSSQYFTGNGFSSILFENAAGNLAIWEMSGLSLIGGGNIGAPGGTWAVKGVGDFNGDGRSDILFQDAAGDLAIWEMNGTSIIGGGTIGNPTGTWVEKGIGDFNGDGRSDILFEDAAGDYAIWEMNGTQIIGGGDIGNPGGAWQFAAIGDYNGDGHADILFTDAAGDLAIWEMNGTSIIGGGVIGNPGAQWHVLG